MNDHPLLLAIEESLGEIASMLGPEWPIFRDRLRALLEQLASAPDPGRAREYTEEILSLSVPAEPAPKTVIGKVSVALDGLPVGTLRVKLDVAPGGWQAPIAVSRVAQRFRRAFISYATHDRAEVLKRVQMLRANRIEFFQDFLNIEPGERWEQRLYQELDSCDVFYLFWSSASKNSEWVRKEIDYTLRRKQGANRDYVSALACMAR